jgi:hypothetical protein
MPYFVNSFAIFWGISNQPEERSGMDFCCPVDIVSNIINVDRLMPGMLIAQNIGPVDPVGCKNERRICRSDRNWILCIPLPISSDNLSIDLTTLRVCKAHRL